MGKKGNSHALELDFSFLDSLVVDAFELDVARFWGLVGGQL